MGSPADDSALAQLNTGLSGLSDAELNNAIDETSSDQEDTNWLKYLQAAASGNAATTKNSFLSKYGILLAGVGVFILVLLLFSLGGKKGK